MKTTCILMCDGLGERWNNHNIKYKHLIPFDGIPLVFRTINQLKQYNTDIILIAPEEFENHPYYPKEIAHTTLGYRETQKRTLADGIVRTRPFWTDRTIILLGDVVFSNHSIHKLLQEYAQDWILGREGSNLITGKQAGELFALVINDPVTVFDEMLNIKRFTPGKLWNYYDICRPYFYQTSDYTDDIDSSQAYDQFYFKLLTAVRRDDK